MSGSAFRIVASVTVPFLVGGGVCIVQGALGIQPQKSYCSEGITEEEKRSSEDICDLTPVFTASRRDMEGVTCPEFTAACCALQVKITMVTNLTSSFKVSNCCGTPWNSNKNICIYSEAFRSLESDISINALRRIYQPFFFSLRNPCLNISLIQACSSPSLLTSSSLW